MATKVFRGDAQPVAHVSTHTVGGTAANGQVYSITINLKTVSYTANGTDTNTTIATALTTALAASTIPEFTELTWSSAAAVITATGGTAGMIPPTITSGATGTGTLVSSVVTASTGPNDLANANNWAPSGVPGASDDAVFQDSAVDALFGFDELEVQSVTFYSSYTGRVGLPATNQSGYREYRSRSWTLDTASVVIGRGGTGGSGQIRLNLTHSTPTVTIEGSSTPADTGTQAIVLTNTGGTITVNITQGDVGIAPNAGDAATVGTLRIGSESSPTSDVTLFVGSGATISTLEQCGGQVSTYGNVSTWNKREGEAVVYAAATVGTLTNEEGEFVWASTGTITTATFRGGDSILDASRDVRTRTLTNGSFTKGASLRDPYKTITFTNAIALDRETLSQCDFGESFSIQRS